MGKVAFMRMCLGTQSCPTLATPWTVPPQASLSIEFSRQEYWSGLPFPSPGVLPDTGIESGSLILQVDSLPRKLPGKPQISHRYTYVPCLPPPTPSHPSRLTQSTEVEFPVSYSKFPLPI